MKKIIFGLGMGALLLTASCKKDIGGLPVNSWSVYGKTFNATTVTSSSATNFITASDGKGSTLDVSFKTLPTANTDFSISDVAYTSGEVAVRTVLSGSVVYNSVKNTAGYVSVRVNGGKYTVIMNDIKLVNTDKATDTVAVSSNIVEM